MYVKRNYSLWMTVRWSKKPLINGLIYSAIIVFLYEVTGLPFSLPWQPISVIGVAVSFFLGFKNNSSYDRAWEARKIWGSIVNDCRTFASAILSLPDKSVPYSWKKQMIFRHLAWLVSLKHNLRKGKSWEHNLPVDKMVFTPGFREEMANGLEPEIRKYLIKSDNNEISYFENRVKDYINLLLTKEYIEKIILVTFPHHDHIFGYITSKNEKNYYSVNVSNIIEKIIKNNQKIYHLNFSQLISEGKINLEKNFFIENDEASHLKEEYHATIFTQKIINHFITMDFLPMN